uniref:Uncharacterized protein n=1 Tax=Triticum urartu TaxID=4572 RepID=A0A8R7TLI6_TRIUA
GGTARGRRLFQCGRAGRSARGKRRSVAGGGGGTASAETASIGFHPTLHQTSSDVIRNSTALLSRLLWKCPSEVDFFAGFITVCCNLP